MPHMRGYDRSQPPRKVGSCSEPQKLENGMHMVRVGTGVVDIIGFASHRSLIL